MFVNFDAFETEDFTTENFGLKTDLEPDYQLVELGFESFFMLLNLGSPLYFLIV